MSVGLLFPGQGSQFVGMGGDLFDLRPDLLGETANSILGFDLKDLCRKGSEDALLRTEHAQPAIFAVSYALFDRLREEGLPIPAGMAGHSLGEYTALTAAGALDYETALRVVARRGRAMAAAAAIEPSGMAALIGADLETANRVCEARQADGGRLAVANINAPGQIVVAGGEADIEWLLENGREHGVRRAIPLNVAGAFHSTFMAPAGEEVEDALSDVVFSEPSAPVWANTTAKPHEVGDVAATLARQVVEPVLFSDSLVAMNRSGIDTYVHCGPGDVTAGLVRKTLPDVTVITVSGVEDIPEALAAIGTMG